jgi:hypothetical protein
MHHSGEKFPVVDDDDDDDDDVVTVNKQIY